MNMNTKLKSLFKTASTSRGYTLLFAVLTAALVMGVAVFIVSISTKQFELSAIVRNSMYSFYAADTGIECVSLAFDNATISTSTGATVACNAITPSAATFATVGAGFPSPLSTTAYPVYQSQPINLDLSSSASITTGPCAVIVIYDGYDSTGTNHYTIADSRGYNHCTSSHVPDSSVPGTVERALRIGKQG